MTPKTIFLIGGPEHGNTLCIKAGTHLLLIDDRTQTTTQVRIEEVTVNGCSFHAVWHPDATPAQTNEVMGKFRHMTRHVRPFTDGRALHMHPGLRDEWDSAQVARDNLLPPLGSVLAHPKTPPT